MLEHEELTGNKSKKNPALKREYAAACLYGLACASRKQAGRQAKAALVMTVGCLVCLECLLPC